MITADSQESVRATSRDDENALQTYYNVSAPAILAFLLRRLRDRYHAGDVLQEAMVIAWNKAHEFDAAKASAKT